MKVPFNKPYLTGNEIKYITDIFKNSLDTAGDGKYTKLVHAWFEKKYKVKKALLTTSGTTALEMAIKLSDLKNGDEVIAPSFTFSSTINAILIENGVKVRFVDIDPVTLNIDPKEIKKAINKRTKVIMLVHYAGAACNMDEIMKIARKHKLIVIEDAAQAIESTYKGKQLGTIGDFGCLSFHGTKNIISGEGGVLFINKNKKKIIERAEIIREKGTNRSKFLRGVIDKYTWVDVGGSFLPSDILAAVLYAQLEEVKKIIGMRVKAYNYYLKRLASLEKQGLLRLPHYPKGVKHNGHIFYILLNDKKTRDFIMSELRKMDIGASSHYVPLHSAPQGIKMGNKKSDLPVTNSVGDTLLRLPVYSGITINQQDYVIKMLEKSLNKYENKN